LPLIESLRTSLGHSERVLGSVVLSLGGIVSAPVEN
jgi:hypothetical protein